MPKKKKSTRQLAKKHQMSQQTISDILLNKLLVKLPVYGGGLLGY